MLYPTIKEIPYQDPLQIFAYFSKQWGAIFLESAQLRDYCGRYSFIAIDPFTQCVSKNSHTDPFQVLTEHIAQFPLDYYPDLPPFQGGVAGFFSYDLCHHLEKIPLHKADDLLFPDLAVGFYDLVIAFDHQVRRAWIFSSGYPLQSKTLRSERASKRLCWLLQKIDEIAPLAPVSSGSVSAKIHSNFTAASYQAAVKRVIRYILEGDIFQANISQRFKTNLMPELNAFDLYRRLRLINPAPFAAYLNFGETILVSASPERFLKLNQGKIETRPIKGTRPRGQNAQDDAVFAEELINSAKDHAENVMIVDLLRNDLSRVCEAYSVKVPQLCALESYSSVHHLVSVVTGQLKQPYSAIDLLRATFPGGSITGAPKIRAMEIIAEIEPVFRGPYCGSIGYIGFNGDMDSSIIIRTYAIKNNIVTFQAGGAIVADSDPLMEYEESLTKASALRRALTNDFIN